MKRRFISVHLIERSLVSVYSYVRFTSSRNTSADFTG
jgi:hypothetical protein